MRSQVARNQVSATTTRNLRTLLLDVLEQAAAGGTTLGVGERIKQARTEAGFTQDQLGDLIGVGMRQVQYYEADESDPYRKLARIAEVTGKSIGWLLHGEAIEEDQLAALRGEVAEVRGMVAELLERSA